MSEISERISAIYSTVADDEPRRDIAPSSVDQAIHVLRNYRIEDAKGLFYYMSAISLLNAAIKMPKYRKGDCRRKEINYNFIKGKARVVVEYVIAQRDFEGVTYYYNAPERCLYVKVFDVVFSFHQVVETDFILHRAANQPHFEWPGIRLQWIAEEVFLIGKELIEQ